eukprot:2405542-Heterocapsa_arctica.AAC.1
MCTSEGGPFPGHSELELGLWGGGEESEGSQDPQNPRGRFRSMDHWLSSPALEPLSSHEHTCIGA